MPFRGSQQYLTDIQESAAQSLEFVADLRFAGCAADQRTKDAVERLLHILTEAAGRLGEDASRLCPEIDWKRISGLGIVLRRVYQDVEDEKIWVVIQNDMPPLLNAWSARGRP